MVVDAVVPLRDQLPLAAVRDLLGICRAMYAAAQRDGNVAQQKELVEIGTKLKLALDLGKTHPESLGHKAAWSHAEEATSRLMRLISVSTPAAPIVQAAVIRIRRIQPGPTQAEERKAAHRQRS